MAQASPTSRPSAGPGRRACIPSCPSSPRAGCTCSSSASRPSTEFYITGHASRIDDPTRRAEVTAASGAWATTTLRPLFEFDLERLLYTHWDNWGTAKTWPNYTRWLG